MKASRRVAMNLEAVINRLATACCADGMKV